MDLPSRSARQGRDLVRSQQRGSCFAADAQFLQSMQLCAHFLHLGIQALYECSLVLHRCHYAGPCHLQGGRCRPQAGDACVDSLSEVVSIHRGRRRKEMREGLGFRA